MCNELNLIELEKLENEIIKQRSDIICNATLKINSILNFLIKSFDLIRKYHGENISLYISSDVSLNFSFVNNEIRISVNNSTFTLYSNNKVDKDVFNNEYSIYLIKKINMINNIDIKNVEKRVINNLKENLLIK